MVQVSIYLPFLCQWGQAVPDHKAAILGHRAQGMHASTFERVLSGSLPGRLLKDTSKIMLDPIFGRTMPR